MCGIFGHLAHSIDVQACIQAYQNLKNRGPDNLQHHIEDHLFFGFCRLRINDLTPEGDQPFEHNEAMLICNGEIYNHLAIELEHGIKTKSHSDCECILHLYELLRNKYNIHELNEKTEKQYSQLISELCSALDAEFVFLLYDKELKITVAARDPYGVRPMFTGTRSDSRTFGSEVKGIQSLVDTCEQFRPGHFMIVDEQLNTRAYESYIQPLSELKILDCSEEEILGQIRVLFRDAVHKRLMSDADVCALLSGGLDSSLVCSLAIEKKPDLQTFSIGIPGSTDIVYAKKVAEFIGSRHTTIEVTEQDFLDAIEKTIQVIESYDITTVRASVGNYLVSKYIREHTNCKVVLNGDYSDEVCGGYIYLKNAKTQFTEECIRLVSTIQFFDSLRSDRTISNNSLEGRVPFADKNFVEYYLSIPESLRHSESRIEKYLVRKAFEDKLPQEVVWRKKEAFSDGVSSVQRSWHKIVQEYIDTKVSQQEFEQHLKNIGCCSSQHNPPKTKEAYYYRKIFQKYYPEKDLLIPYYWLPKFTAVQDEPSARALDHY